MLNYSYSQIKNSKNPVTHVDSDVELSSEFFERSKELITKAKNVHVTGDFFYQEPFVTGNFRVTADVEVPSTRSLKPVELHQDFTFTENYSDVKPTQEQLEEEDTIIMVEDDLIDLQTAVEDNLLLSLPSVVLTKDEKEKGIFPEGKDWRVISEKEYQEEKSGQENPAFAKLKDFFKSQDKN
ncbi:uncharacterized protein J2Z60_000012 [Lactobacillus colini]|uniref:DUF177 domain-containing protein n=1 Tax=Lactobacillus colini TaxID=1819254 RepID=A0ABS4MAZ9_9LACO|nr:DUF177 domain-containing protein [Lactobacillus colini]MBP2056850.1 uncharacterized protein [Lactobacillus colini]